MESLSLLYEGFNLALQFQNIILVVIACFIGTCIGMLPSIGPINAIAILFPITFSLGLPPASVFCFYSYL